MRERQAACRSSGDERSSRDSWRIALIACALAFAWVAPPAASPAAAAGSGDGSSRSGGKLSSSSGPWRPSASGTKGPSSARSRQAPAPAPAPAASAAPESAPPETPAVQTDFIAYGFARRATGGAGHPVIEVTNLRDSRPGPPVPGSLRAALSGGNRTIRFRVSGNIELTEPLVIRHDNITLDGSDAPNGGIAIWGQPLVIEASNVVIRHLRFRGSHPTDSVDAIGIGGGSDILIDHVSCSWATDECLSIYGYSYTGKGRVRRVTVQHSLFFEMTPDHNMTTLVNGDVSHVTWFRNVFAKSDNRNPQISTGQRRGPGQRPGERLAGIAPYELIQNVVYDAVYATRIWNQSPDWEIQLDAIGNLWKPGPRWPDPKVPIMVFTRPASVGPIRVFLDRNTGPRRSSGAPRECDFFSLESANSPCGGYEARHGADQRLVQSHTFPGTTAAEDLPRILANAGATLPCRDAADRRIVEEVRTGTGQRSHARPRLPDLTRPCGQ